MSDPRPAERLLFGRPSLYALKRFLIEDVLWKGVLSGVFRLEPNPIPETVAELAAGRVLLAACGPGHVTTGPMPEGDQGVVAFDLSRAFARRCAQERPAWQVYCGDLSRLPHADRSFDTGVLYSALHHLPFGAEPALRELSRVCDRVLVLEGVVPASGWLRRLLLVWYRAVDGGHHYYTENELRGIAERLGLEHRRSSRHGPIRHMWLTTLAHPDAPPCGEARARGTAMARRGDSGAAAG